MEIVNIIAQRLNINEQQVQRTIKLLNEGATIPFISRYRKEVTLFYVGENRVSLCLLS